MTQHTTIIAEIAQAHNGDRTLLHKYIDAVSTTGVDIIKFQTHIAEAESSVYEPFRIKLNTPDRTRFDYWKRMEFRKGEWKEIKEHSEDMGMEFMSSPFSIAAVDLLEELGVKRYKIGSGEITNFLMLEKIAKTKKSIILSSGMSCFEELDETINFLRPFGNDLAILQCTTQYPTNPEKVGLNVIGELKQRYSLPVGLSDHSGTIYPALAAVVLGAEIIEVHVIFDKADKTPDAPASVTIELLKVLVDGVRFLEKSIACKVDKSINEQYSEEKQIFEKSLAVNKELEEGHVLAVGDLESKKPFGQGIPAKNYQSVVGMKLKISKKKYDFLTDSDIKR